MTTHYDDEAEVENLKRWWKDNWVALAAGLGIGLGAIFGWELWQGHKSRQAEQASQMFEDLKKAAAADQEQPAQAAGDKLVAEFPSSPYAVAAALLLANEAVEHNRLDEAQRRLQWVLDQTKDDGIRRLAKLRQARVQVAQGKPDDALRLLDGESGDYAMLYDELRGDIKLAQGDRAAARQAYEKALQGAGEAAPERELLQRKLDDLAEAVQS